MIFLRTHNSDDAILLGGKEGLLAVITIEVFSWSYIALQILF